jgi:predicted flavoprotein YhiN
MTNYTDPKRYTLEHIPTGKFIEGPLSQFQGEALIHWTVRNALDQKRKTLRAMLMDSSAFTTRDGK